MFHKAIRKYGIDNILWEIIGNGETWKEVAEIEKTEIAKMRIIGHCYNQLDGGDGLEGVKHSEAWKEHLSKIMTGRVFSEEHKNKISNSLKGIKRGTMSECHKNKIRMSCKGQKRNEEQIKAMKAAAKKWHKEKPKVIFDVFSKNGEHMSRFYCYREFIEKFGGSSSGVHAGLNGDLKSYKGYILKKVINAPTTTASIV